MVVSIRNSLILLLTIAVSGCFKEAANPIQPGDFVPVHARERLTSRPWLRSAAPQLKPLLPESRYPPLLTEDLVLPNGCPMDVHAYFHVDPDKLDQLLYNYEGLRCTAEATGPNQTRGLERIVWSGYEETWIPINSHLSLCGEMGWATKNGQVIDSDCIIILPGVLGHNSIRRTKDLADALRQRGFHVLPLELRGHGRTEDRYPDVFYNFSVLETGDLMTVSEWLQAQPHIRRTGLVGFCWSANQGLLAAWEDGRPEEHVSISPKLAPHMRPRTSARHFEAGIVAFSPVLRFEEVIEATYCPQPKWRHPVLAALQETIRQRMIYKNHPNPGGNLRTLIDDEFARSELNYPGAVEDGLDSLRLLPFRDLDDGHKLVNARIPVLIVHAANDPLTPPQAVADLMARTPNPNVSAIILPGGGHIGFTVYARSYYFSLIMNFFDPKTGPVAVSQMQPLPGAISGGQKRRPQDGSPGAD